MKYRKIRLYIIISMITYMVLVIGLCFSAKLYVDKKDERLRKEAYDNLYKVFSEQSEFVNIVFSGKDINYEKISVPKAPKPPKVSEDSLTAIVKKMSYNQDLEDWNDRYNDIYKLYRLKPRKVEYGFQDNTWCGWELHIIRLDSNGFVEYIVYPYQVGYRKQRDSWSYQFMPSVQQAVDEAFEFYTTDKKSNYFKYITNKAVSHYDISDIVNNEYYFLFSYDNMLKYNSKEYVDSLVLSSPIQVDYAYVDDRSFGDYGYMYNGYYKVYNYMATQGYWRINYRFYDPKKKDMNSIIMWGGITLTILLLCCIIPLSVIGKMQNKLNSESLKDKLLRVSNPNNFMKPYDEEKVNMANEIYARLQNITSDNRVSLNEIRKEISDKLGVNFINVEQLKDLGKRCNPQNFMNPYNEDKVKIANRLYAKLQDSNLSIDEFESIQNEYDTKLKM